MDVERKKQSDEQVVENARQVIAAKGQLRWNLLFCSAIFLGFCGYATFIAKSKVETLDAEQLNMGFLFGLGLAFIWTTLGVIGGLCLGKFLSGFQGDFRKFELLVSYHDRLRDLGQLPNEKSGKF